MENVFQQENVQQSSSSSSSLLLASPLTHSTPATDAITSTIDNTASSLADVLEWPLAVNGMKDLRNRVNCWRLDVDATTTTTGGGGSNPAAAATAFGFTMSGSSRAHRRRNNSAAAAAVRSNSGPYFSWHNHHHHHHRRPPPRPHSFNAVHFINNHNNNNGPVVSQFGDHPPPQEEDDDGMLGVEDLASLKTPSITREASAVGHGGSDLPHPERNPLITHQPEIAKEEYYRMLGLFNRLNAERRRAEVRLVQQQQQEQQQQEQQQQEQQSCCRATTEEARQHLMDVGTTIQHVIVAAQYVVDYSHSHGWDIDFDALLYDDLIPPVKMLPSTMRELVCSSSAAHAAGADLGWHHLQPAA